MVFGEKKTSRVDRLIIIDSKSIPCDDKTLPPSPWIYRVNSNSLSDKIKKEVFDERSWFTHEVAFRKKYIDKRLPSPVFRVKKRWDRPISRAANTKTFWKKEKRYVY